MDTTPLWLIAVFAVIIILFLIYLEMRHQRKNPGGTHYTFNQIPDDKNLEIYRQTRDKIKKVDSEL